MPFNKIHVPEDLAGDTCRLINEELHKSLVQTCGSNPDDHFCLIVRYRPDDMLLHPSFLGTRDPQATIVIEIALLRGRSDVQKESLYRNIRERLEKIGFDANNSIVFLIENNPIDWSFSPDGSVKAVMDM